MLRPHNRAGPEATAHHVMGAACAKGSQGQRHKYTFATGGLDSPAKPHSALPAPGSDTPGCWPEQPRGICSLTVLSSGPKGALGHGSLAVNSPSFRLLTAVPKATHSPLLFWLEVSLQRGEPVEMLQHRGSASLERNSCWKGRPGRVPQKRSFRLQIL